MTSIFESLENNLVQLQNLINTISLEPLKNIISIFASEQFITSTKISEKFSEKISEFLNLVADEKATSNIDKIAGKIEEISNLFQCHGSMRIYDFIIDLKNTTATILIAQHLHNSTTFTQDLAYSEIYKNIETAMTNYHQDKSQANAEALKALKASVTAHLNIFADDLAFCKSIDEKLHLANSSITKGLEDFISDYNRLSNYIDISLNFQPGVLQPDFDNTEPLYNENNSVISTGMLEVISFA